MTRPCGHKAFAPRGQCVHCDAEWTPDPLNPSSKPIDLSAKETNPKDHAASARLDLSLFPATARAYGALAFAEGDLKYGGYNWRVAGVKASVYFAACNRHLDKWFNGQNEDPVTGVPHLANAIACLAVLVDATEVGKLNDDRPPRCDMTALLSWAERRVRGLQETFGLNGPERYTHSATSGDPQ